MTAFISVGRPVGVGARCCGMRNQLMFVRCGRNSHTRSCVEWILSGAAAADTREADSGSWHRACDE